MQIKVFVRISHKAGFPFFRYVDENNIKFEAMRFEHLNGKLENGTVEVNGSWKEQPGGYDLDLLIDHKGVIRHKFVGNPGDKKLDELIEAGEAGCTPIDHPGPRGKGVFALAGKQQRPRWMLLGFEPIEIGRTVIQRHAQDLQPGLQPNTEQLPRTPFLSV
jgi:hypothetical protein